MRSNFRTKTYQLYTDKMDASASVRFALISDLHGVSFGDHNCRLLKTLEEASPDAILIAGDLNVTRYYDTLDVAYYLVSTLCRRYPVFYSLGNHEYKMLFHEERQPIYAEYERKLTEKGACFLRNGHTDIILKEQKFTIYGLELPLPYYHKPNSPKLSLQTMESLIGKPDDDSVDILLAHNPKYGNTYLDWAADLTVSGHYHGGVVRLSENVGLCSPQFLILPPYCCGKFEKNGKYMIVSAGLGDHTIPQRFHNPRELILIDVHGK